MTRMRCDHRCRLAHPRRAPYQQQRAPPGSRRTVATPRAAVPRRPSRMRWGYFRLRRVVRSSPPTCNKTRDRRSSIDGTSALAETLLKHSCRLGASRPRGGKPVAIRPLPHFAPTLLHGALQDAVRIYASGHLAVAKWTTSRCQSDFLSRMMITSRWLNTTSPS